MNFLQRYQSAFCWMCLVPVLAGLLETRLCALDYERDIEPILIDFCYDCHGDGMDKGKVALDVYQTNAERLNDKELWLRVIKNLRAELMPPSDKPQPGDKQLRQLENWIKRAVFELDSEHPNPGRVTMRRLNRVEYQHTIRDLMGIEFKVFEEFPPDDTGFGFDNIGDVLSVSPLLMEKYMDASEMIVSEAVPTVSLQMDEQNFGDSEWRNSKDPDQRRSRHSFYEEVELERPFEIQKAGEYEVLLEHEVRGDFDFDPGQCQVRVELDGASLLETTYQWQNRKRYPYSITKYFEPGKHTLRLHLQPLQSIEEKKNNVDLRLAVTSIKGPSDKKHWVRPPNFDRFFQRSHPPEDENERLQYARETLTRFVFKAYRRPVSGQVVDRLMAIAQSAWDEAGKSFEAGIAEAMKAVLASPYFVFRVEETTDQPLLSGEHPNLDEFALASRLSYFLWSTMPDQELLDLAKADRLKDDWPVQVNRLLKDPRSEAWRNAFVGQWLQARDIESVPLNARAILARESSEERKLDQQRSRYFELRRKPEESLTEEEVKEVAALREIRFQFFRPSQKDLDGSLRRAMRRETEMLFGHIVGEDRSVLELLDSNYAFLNEELAKHYDIEGVEGDRMRKVSLPEGSPRGGILTQGTFLAVTSNPTRTSPVKRGLFILDNLLGTPAPPPPGDVPPLEEAAAGMEGREPTLRETLELHRADAICRSCHERMDPLGLALENFNPLGLWRTQEFDQPVAPEGQLVTGEAFTGIGELKSILTTTRRLDFYRCLTEKLMIYALGRGLDYRDVETVDQIVANLDAQEGRFSVLLMGILNSSAFQKRQSDETLHVRNRSASKDSVSFVQQTIEK